MVVGVFPIIVIVLVHVGRDGCDLEPIGVGNCQTLLVHFFCHARDSGRHPLGVEVEIALGSLDPARVHECRRAMHDWVDVVQPNLEQVLTPH